MNEGPCSIRRAMAHRGLFASALGDHASWRLWAAILAAAFGLGLTAEERELFDSVAGGRQTPAHRVRQLWAVVGRGGGKSRMAALMACYLAACVDYSRQLAPGERGTVLCVAPTKAQADIVAGYCRGFLEASPLLRDHVASITADEIVLTSGVTIAIVASSFRSIRGRTMLAVVCDELSFMRDSESGSLNPDIELIRAVTPSLIRAHGMLIAISSPYRKTGAMFAAHKAHFGQDSDDVLVIQGPSIAFNPTLDQAAIDAATAEDPAAAVAEWGGQFRTDITAFLSEEDIERAIDYGRPSHLPPRPRLRYVAYMDPSGGRGDAYTLCVAHVEGQVIVVDALVRRAPPFDPQAVTAELCALAKQYGVGRVISDNYSAEWAASAIRACGLGHQLSELSASDQYLEGLPHFTRGLVRIPNDPVLLRELRLLERRTTRLGRDSVVHPVGGSDDCANGVFGAAFMLKGRAGMAAVPAEAYSAAIAASNARLRARPDPRAVDLYALHGGGR
jgi:hypothetical protein